MGRLKVAALVAEAAAKREDLGDRVTGSPGDPEGARVSVAAEALPVLVSGAGHDALAMAEITKVRHSPRTVQMSCCLGLLSLRIVWQIEVGPSMDGSSSVKGSLYWVCLLVQVFNSWTPVGVRGARLIRSCRLLELGVIFKVIEE